MSRKRFNGRLEDFRVFHRRQFCGPKCCGAAHRLENPTLGGLRSRAQMQTRRLPSCEMCGGTHRQMDRHHKDRNPANNAQTNVMTLCAPCHARWHWQNGKREKRNAA